jgi:hypothetical protein
MQYTADTGNSLHVLGIVLTSAQVGNQQVQLRGEVGMLKFEGFNAY